MGELGFEIPEFIFASVMSVMKAWFIRVGLFVILAKFLTACCRAAAAAADLLASVPCV